MMKKKLLILPMAFFLYAGTSYATVQLKIEDLTNGGPVVLVTDNGGNDLDTDIGAIFSLVNSTSIKITTINTIVAGLDLNNVVVTSASAIDLRISLTDTDFQLDGLNGSLIGDVSGTLGDSGANSAQFDYYYNTSNGGFDTVGASTATTGTFTGTSNFGGSVGPVDVAGTNNPFSLTQTATLSLGSNDQVSYDSDLRVIPEPSILALLGLGLLGFVGSRRK